MGQDVPYLNLINFRPHENMIRETDNFYLNQEEPNKSCMLALRKIILDQDAAVTETRKWGMPCFCYQKKYSAICGRIKKRRNPICFLWKANTLTILN